MAKFRPVTHVIFDVDGVILDTEKLYTLAVQNIVSRYGKTFTWEIKTKVMGTHRTQLSKIVVKELDLPITWEEFSAMMYEEYKVVMANPDVYPAAEKLIQHLSKNKIPISCATASGQDNFEIKTTNHKDLFKLFDHIVCGGTELDFKRLKPAPDIFLLSASRFPDKPKPENCLVIEDAPNGVQAALNAGMQVVMIPDEKVSIELRKGATLIVASLDEIPLEKFGLPPLKCSCKTVNN